ITSLVRDVVESLRREGKKVGLIKLRTFRPFPNDEIRKALKNVNKVIVLERAVSFGNEGQVAIEVKNALYGKSKEIYSFAIGLGGRDVPRELIVKIIDNVMQGKVKQGFHFEGVQEFKEVIP
ncbi:MAG TPA: pyruvate ferredoxin oxidoreductase, partial [Archaeoglobus veneficus]|nr:pyruvate ferredoxin oxidoreductase [Archaeoglobus veneficus]